MTADDLATLAARLEAAVSNWRDERRRKAQPWVVEEARERANKLLNDYSDAVVLAMTAPKTAKPRREAQEVLPL